MVEVRRASTAQLRVEVAQPYLRALGGLTLVLLEDLRQMAVQRLRNHASLADMSVLQFIDSLARTLAWPTTSVLLGLILRSVLLRLAGPHRVDRKGEDKVVTVIEGHGDFKLVDGRG